MDVPKTDLVVGLIGAIALVGLVIGLFVVGGNPPQTDGPTTGGDIDGDNGTGPVIEYANASFTGTVEAGAFAQDQGQPAEETHTFDVPNGTTEIRVTLTLGDGQGDLDCHLYDPRGQEDEYKHGDDTCHTGSFDNPDGGEVTINASAAIPGEWTLVVHTAKSDDSPIQVNTDRDYTAEIVVPYRATG